MKGKESYILPGAIGLDRIERRSPPASVTRLEVPNMLKLIGLIKVPLSAVPKDWSPTIVVFGCSLIAPDPVSTSIQVVVNVLSQK